MVLSSRLLSLLSALDRLVKTSRTLSNNNKSPKPPQNSQHLADFCWHFRIGGNSDDRWPQLLLAWGQWREKFFSSAGARWLSFCGATWMAQNLKFIALFERESYIADVRPIVSFWAARSRAEWNQIFRRFERGVWK